jgi:hypothetical protein
MLGTKRLVVKRVTSDGEPVSLRNDASAYGNALECIVRECCNINKNDLRHPDNSELRDVLIKRIHKRFEFPDDPKDVLEPNTEVNNHAITKMSKRWSGWKSKAKNEMYEKNYSKVQARWPSISEDG